MLYSDLGWECKAFSEENVPQTNAVPQKPCELAVDNTWQTAQVLFRNFDHDLMSLHAAGISTPGTDTSAYLYCRARFGMGTISNYANSDSGQSSFSGQNTPYVTGTGDFVHIFQCEAGVEGRSV